MEIRQLQHFVAVHRLRSFGKAAFEHGITQSALSRSLQKLETEIGHRLFDRNTHEVQPTAAGNALIDWARNVVDAMHAFGEEAHRLAGGEGGHVRIGTGPYPAHPLVTNTISELAAKHPGIQVSVVAGTAKDLLVALVERELDFVVCDVSKYDDSPSAERISVVRLPAEPLVVLTATTHPFDVTDPEQAADYAWALPTPAPWGTRELPKPFQDAYQAGRFPYYRLEATAACIELARAGHAVTLVPRSLAIEACRDPGLRFVEVPAPIRTNDGIHLVRNRSRSSVAQRAIEIMLEVAKAQARTASNPGQAQGTRASRLR
ncbi:MAG: LysR family transcriptional regulator [Myxococcota bacterium]